MLIKATVYVCSLHEKPRLHHRPFRPIHDSHMLIRHTALANPVLPVSKFVARGLPIDPVSQRDPKRRRGLLVPDGALPNSEDSPACFTKIAHGLLITPDIRQKLLGPEFAIRGRHLGVATSGMLVPETAVNEDRDLSARQDDIGSAGQILPVQSEAKARSEQGPPDSEFRSGVLAPDSGHHATAGFGRDDVCHGAAIIELRECPIAASNRLPRAPCPSTRAFSPIPKSCGRRSSCEGRR